MKIRECKKFQIISNRMKANELLRLIVRIISIRKDKSYKFKLRKSELIKVWINIKKSKNSYIRKSPK